jgi:hypothetical protein
VDQYTSAIVNMMHCEEVKSISTRPINSCHPLGLARDGHRPSAQLNTPCNLGLMADQSHVK